MPLTPTFAAPTLLRRLPLARLPPSHALRACASAPADTSADAPAPADTRVAQVVLRRGRAARLRAGGSRLVYAGAVARVVPRGARARVAPAEAVAVVDGAGGRLGYGVYNAGSMFAVRLLSVFPAERSKGDEIRRGGVRDVEGFCVGDEVGRLVGEAFGVRRAVGLPCEGTSVFRAVNGEADGLSGLAVDVFGGTAVVVSSALWTERYREEIEGAVRDAMGGRVVWRTSVQRLKQDGAADVAEEDRGLFRGLAFGEDGSVVGGDVEGGDEDVAVVENGVQYVLPAEALRGGQKSGFYADQRESRRMVRELVARRGGGRVLDCYCYSGGFGVGAAMEGAEVVGVDSSEGSLEMGRVNAERNGVAARVRFVKDDVPTFLKRAAEAGEQWDVVVLDPPKLAPNTRALDRASHKYRQINQCALKVVSQNGVLVTCSCSAAMTKNRDLFLQAVRKAAANVGREVVLLETRGAAPDHPVDMSEGAVAGGYLTVFVFAVK